MALANLYFDESGTHKGSRLMSMAGYWFDQKQAARFSRDWQKDLANLGLSHAHMTDCTHQQGEYKRLTREECLKAQTLLITHIKRRSRFGFGVCISPVAYERAMEAVRGAPSAYSLCLMLCANKVAEFANVIGYEGKLTYFFESGHAKEKEAQRYMGVIPTLGDVAIDFHRYAGHFFVDKRMALPLQAADMFAWQLRHYYERRLDGFDRPRKDYVALMRPFDFQVLVSHTHILALRETFLRVGPLLEAGRLEEAAYAGYDILDDFGLPQLPTWVPKNTVAGRTSDSAKRIIRF